MALTKTDHAGYLYDEKSNVVINTNETDLLNYRKQIEQSKKIKSITDEFATFKDEIAQLKQMLLEKNK